MLSAAERRVTSFEFKTRNSTLNLRSAPGTISRLLQDEKKRSGGVKSIRLMNKTGSCRAVLSIGDENPPLTPLFCPPPSPQTDKHRVTVPGRGARAAAADGRAAGSAPSGPGLGAADGAGGETRLQAERLERLQFKMQIIDSYINHQVIDLIK